MIELLLVRQPLHYLGMLYQLWTPLFGKFFVCLVLVLGPVAEDQIMLAVVQLYWPRPLVENGAGLQHLPAENLYAKGQNVPVHNFLVSKERHSDQELCPDQVEGSEDAA